MMSMTDQFADLVRGGEVREESKALMSVGVSLVDRRLRWLVASEHYDAQTRHHAAAQMRSVLNDLKHMMRRGEIPKSMLPKVEKVA